MPLPAHLRALLGCTRQAPAATLNYGQLGEQRDQEHAKAAWKQKGQRVGEAANSAAPITCRYAYVGCFPAEKHKN